MQSIQRRFAALAITLTCLAVIPQAAAAQWVTTYETFYKEAPYNWTFLHRYPAAAKLFNGFDFGHAILYETLWTKPDAPKSELEEKWYRTLTTEILAHPPAVPLEEAAIEVAYARLAPEAKAMFDWAHLLHRQIYDVWADSRYTDEQRDVEVRRLIAYYKTRKDLAFSSTPKSMRLMQEQPYSLAFRKKYPKFNGLIWAYHWMQIGLYEPLLATRDEAQRHTLVTGMVARFWQMMQDSPQHLPYQMPMTVAVAPQFAARYPEAAIIFDNLHSMHDVVSDILANPDVPRNRKRAELQLAAARYRDDTSFVMTVAGWRNMAMLMGVENMGGPALATLENFPVPTVTYGAVMSHDDVTGAHIGMPYGQRVGMAHGEHGGMSGMPGMSTDSAAKGGHAQHGAAPDAMPAGRADTSMRSMPGMKATTDSTAHPATHAMPPGTAMPATATPSKPTVAPKSRRRTARRAPPATKQATKPAAKPAAMPGMRMPP